METILACDVYGTIVDSSAMAKHLSNDAGDRAQDFVQLWRKKQIEYALRRGLMQNYAPFSVCTEEALQFTCQHLQINIPERRRGELLKLYAHLPAFDDVPHGLAELKKSARIFAFSNGKYDAVDKLLTTAGLRRFFDGIISGDDLKTFKPNPAVYGYARRAAGALSKPFFVVSSNPWDVIGARSAGFDAVWLKRSEQATFDPWGIEPTVTVESFDQLAHVLPDFVRAPRG